MRKGRFRAVVRWVCTVTALVVVGAAVFCLFGSAEYSGVADDGYTPRVVELSGGLIMVAEWPGIERMSPLKGTGWRLREPSRWSLGRRVPTDGSWPWRWGFLWEHSDYPIGRHSAGVTLLYPFVVTATPAALLWYSHLRRPRPNQCKSCGYSRRGLAPDAPCPECGHKQKSPPSAAATSAGSNDGAGV